MKIMIVNVLKMISNTNQINVDKYYFYVISHPCTKYNIPLKSKWFNSMDLFYLKSYD